MKPTKFRSVVDNQISLCRDTLLDREGSYATKQDRLHNFKRAAELQGITMEQALYGMMTKHTIALSDVVWERSVVTEDEITERITDSINYLLLLKATFIEKEET